MPRFAKKGSTRQDIFNIIRADLEKAGEAEGLFDEDIFTMKDTSRAKSIRGDIVREWLHNCVAYSDMNKTLQKDLAKVSFDWENAEEAWSEELLDHLPDGTALLWCYAGGDWEFPVHFCFYIDQTNKLRAYIPSDGNLYCHHCKTAWGSCECEKGEEEENKRQEEHGDEEPLPDFPKVYADACNRIQIKGEEGAKKPAATKKKVYSLVHSARRIYQFKQHDTVEEAEDDVKRKLLSMTEDGDSDNVEKGSRQSDLPENAIACWRTMAADLDEDNDPFWVDEGCPELYGIVFETDKQFVRISFGMGAGDSDAAEIEFYDDYAKACKEMRKIFDESLKECQEINDDPEEQAMYPHELKHGEEDNCCMMSWDDGCGGCTEVDAVLDVTKIDEYGA